jgi:hypothetical protein
LLELRSFADEQSNFADLRLEEHSPDKSGGLARSRLIAQNP